MEKLRPEKTTQRLEESESKTQLRENSTEQSWKMQFVRKKTFVQGERNMSRNQAPPCQDTIKSQIQQGQEQKGQEVLPNHKQAGSSPRNSRQDLAPRTHGYQEKSEIISRLGPSHIHQQSSLQENHKSDSQKMSPNDDNSKNRVPTAISSRLEQFEPLRKSTAFEGLKLSKVNFKSAFLAPAKKEKEIRTAHLENQEQVHVPDQAGQRKFTQPSSYLNPSLKTTHQSHLHSEHQGGPSAAIQSSPLPKHLAAQKQWQQKPPSYPQQHFQATEMPLKPSVELAKVRKEILNSGLNTNTSLNIKPRGLAQENKTRGSSISHLLARNNNLNQESKRDASITKKSEKVLFFKKLLNDQNQSGTIDSPQQPRFSKSVAVFNVENKLHADDQQESGRRTRNYLGLEKEIEVKPFQSRQNPYTPSRQAHTSHNKHLSIDPSNIEDSKEAGLPNRLNRIIYTPRADDAIKQRSGSTSLKTFESRGVSYLPNESEMSSSILKIGEESDSQSVIGNEEEEFNPKHLIKRWIDHSSKYGLVYIMEKGLIGIFFNDNSKLLFQLENLKFVYIAKDPKRNREQVKIYTLKFPPKDIEIKIGIMQDIRKSLSENEKVQNGSQQQVQQVDLEAEINIEKVKDLVYVKNWVKARQVTVFKLIDSTYQAIFQDKSQILMNSSYKSMIFIDKDKQKKIFKINSQEITNNRSLHVRIEYFKKVLRKWIERDTANKSSLF